MGREMAAQQDGVFTTVRRRTRWKTAQDARSTCASDRSSINSTLKNEHLFRDFRNTTPVANVPPSHSSSRFSHTLPATYEWDSGTFATVAPAKYISPSIVTTGPAA